VAGRGNLDVLLNATAGRILWNATRDSNGNAVADAAEVILQDGIVVTIHAKREIILAAGAIRSPGILERSGVGNPAILSAQGISVQVPLPSVGENFQDQTIIPVAAATNLSTNFTGLPGFVAHVSLSDLLGAETEAFYNATLAKLPQYAATVAAQNGGASNASVQESLLKGQLELLYASNTPTTEVVPLGLASLVGAIVWPLQPFSRGSIHINSTNATATPLIDAKFFQFDGDGTLAVASARFARRFLTTPPFSYIVNASTITPTLATVPLNASDSVWLDWIKNNSGYQPNYHHLGTCAMLPRDMGGVVDNGFKVYGTGNVRVVDLSVVPVQVAGHSTSLLYGVAEWAARKIGGVSEFAG
jgi:choline dehydrogenase-like flavoprotein